MTEPNIENFGFIIVRHMTNDIDKQYWQECVHCIRKFYPEEKIIVVDDNSSLKPSSDQLDIETYTNVTIVQAEYPGAGEVLGYYYGWKNKPFKKFVVLHDSMFLQSKLPESIAEQEVIFLWHFCTYLGQGVEGYNKDNNVTFINHCKPEQQPALFKLYYDKSAWFGNFGVSSVVSLDLVERIFTNYNFLNIIQKIKNRHDREAMERVFALIAYLEEPLLKIKPSLLGNIKDYKNSYAIRWEHYKNGYRTNCAVNKVWSGR
jgi:hypothetical protein